MTCDCPSALPTPEAGVLDEPYSAKTAQRSSHTGPPGCIEWTRFQPMLTGGPVRQLRLAGLADYKVPLKLSPLVHVQIINNNDIYIITLLLGYLAWIEEKE